jgi:hypothetical protein
MSSDWFPNSRDEIAHMAKAWIAVLQTTAAAWAVPQATVTELQTQAAAAEGAWDQWKAGRKNPESTAHCQALFNTLEKTMRLIHGSYLNEPPRTAEERISMLLRPRDTHPSPVGAPDIPPRAELRPGAPAVMDVHLSPAPGYTSADPRSLFGFSVYYSLVPPGGQSLEQAVAKKELTAPPASPEELNRHFFTHARKYRLVLTPDDAGKTLYLCPRYENHGNVEGPWGEPVSRVVS